MPQLGRIYLGAPCNGTKRRITVLKPEQKKWIIAEYATHESDTDSPEAQIALFSTRTKKLIEYFHIHEHGHHSWQGLMLLIGQRKRFLAYLAEEDIEHYRSLIACLSLHR